MMDSYNLTELNKDDKLSHSSGACFHILVHRCDINFNKVLYISSYRTAGSVLGTGFQAFVSDWDRVTATVSF